jgi:hypothetical protein
MNTTGTNSSLNHGVTPSIGESGFLHTPENGEQGNNPLNKTFVKVTFPPWDFYNIITQIKILSLFITCIFVLYIVTGL